MTTSRSPARSRRPSAHPGSPHSGVFSTTASILILPVGRVARPPRIAKERHRNMAADQIVGRQAAAAIRHVNDVDAGLQLQHLAGQMMRRGDARRAELHLAGIGLSIGDQLGHRLHRQFGVHRDDDDVGASIGDRCEILHRVERHAFVEMHIRGHHRVGADHQRRAVGRGAGDRGGADVAAGAGPVFDHDRLAKRRLQPVHDARGRRRRWHRPAPAPRRW